MNTAELPPSRPYAGSYDTEPDAARARVRLLVNDYLATHRDRALADMSVEDALSQMLRWHVAFTVLGPNLKFEAPNRHGEEVFAYMLRHGVEVRAALLARVNEE